MRFRLTLGVNSPIRKLVVRRIVIALGAMRSTSAVPALLDTLALAPCDVKLGEAVGWALANIGEAALLPLLSFGRRRNMPVPARALAVVTIGYIADSRVSTTLNHLWREYCLEEPGRAIAARLGLTVCGQGDQARERAAQTEQLWQARVSRREAGTGTVFEQAAKMLSGAVEEVNAAESLPSWRRVLHSWASP